MFEGQPSMKQKEVALTELAAGNKDDNNGRSISTDSFYFERMNTSGNELSPAVRALQDIQFGAIDIGVGDDPRDLDDYYEAPQFGLGETI